ncbi:MAG: S8 family serine peptidase [Ignavibacteriales bacterium]|nr:MAG: S8 family serine peptidase [Ignavibacteriaceae bacterium]MBW7874200.1 S8 family serine peptidase [Ignavibacteria bacterium]MCZ2142328.1 S8 family serine peptidase [Ignavibacteriales bacterium]OQY75666.1 MAG: hypothetical protein B6D45_05435 [Ignavibacteriales bacterium UTCHB3]MBV6445213.1 hypothetical protein [Ignavibacteriaceae bacterium]
MRKIFSLFFFIFVAVPLFAQNAEQKEWLKNFAKEQNDLWQAGRQQAESLAVKWNLPIRKEFPDGTVIEIQGVQDGVPVYHITDNVNSAKTIATDKVQVGNSYGVFSLDGSGTNIGLWEAGGIPRATHQELDGRATSKDGGGAQTQHATHTAGTLIASGVSPNAKGMSPNGHIDYYTSSNDLSEITAAAAAGLRVSSHSYGQIVGWRWDYYGDSKWTWMGNENISPTEDYRFGFYSQTSQAWDNMLNNAPNLLVVKSAGNDRGEGPAPGTPHHLYPNSTTLVTTVRDLDGGDDGYDCINDGVGIAKNTLTIGAVSRIPNGWTSPSSVVMSSFSGWGPTDDGRIKPDVVADGVNLYSSSHESNTAYATISGTSMATPSVAGSVGDLLQLQQQLHGSTPLRAATLKALIFHTADEAGANPGPDYVFGWGLMNTFNAALLMKVNKDVGNDALIKEEVLNNAGQFQYQVQSNGTEPLKATINWTDPAGTPPPVSLNPQDIMLKNDLDLRITGPGGTFYPWVLDPFDPSAAATTGDNYRDNTEQILIANPAAGNYTITVTHKGGLVNGSQPFSLVVSGIAIPVPAQVSLTTPANGATGVDVNAPLGWTVGERASKYHLQVATDNSFSTIAYENNAVAGVNFTVQDTLNGLTQYFWRVRSGNSGGFSNWSEVRSFTTALAIPAVPVNVYPEHNSKNISVKPTVDWQGDSYAQKYWLRVSKNALFSNLVFNDSTITQNYHTIDSLAEQTKYYWRVVAINQAGSSAPSPSSIFTTGLFAPSNLSAVVNQNGKVDLTWVDRSNLENKFYIMRAQGDNDYAVIDSVLGANSTSYTDNNPITGELSYKVLAANDVAMSDPSDAAAASVTSVKEGNQPGVPKEFALEQNYPNPFNPSTEIMFALPWESNVKLTIYNTLGEKVDELVNKPLRSGYYTVTWNASAYNSGVYFYTITATTADGKNINITKKMLLVK